MVPARKRIIFLSAALMSACASFSYALPGQAGPGHRRLSRRRQRGREARNYIAAVFLDRAAFTKRAAEDYRIKAELIKTLDISAQ